jgi:assimilatory nitrate reductase catalytic subunit
VKHRQIPEPPDGDFPYLLTTGRVMGQYQSGAQTRRVPALMLTDPDPFVELHPDLARRLGVAPGDAVELTSRRGSAVFRARVTDTIRADTVFAPFHWGGRFAANALTDPVLDKHSKMPGFKVCAVSLQRLGDSDALGSAEAESVAEVTAAETPKEALTA